MSEISYDSYVRVLADLENFKRRRDSDIDTAIKKAKREIILELLPLLDDIEIGVKFNAELEVLYTKYLNIMSNIGVERYGEVGDVFNEELHNAVYTFSTGNVPEGCISEIIKSGYKYNGEIIRYADVIVKYSGNTKS